MTRRSLTLSLRRRPTQLAATAVVVAALVATLNPVPAFAGSERGHPPSGTPQLGVEPIPLTSQQLPDTQVTQELTIDNQGEAPLEWSVYQDVDPDLWLPIRPTTPVETVPTTGPSGPGKLKPFVVHSGRGQRDKEVELKLPPVPPGQIMLTHSPRQAVVAGRSVSCQGLLGLWEYETSYLRHFTPADFGVVGDLQVSSVSFGVEGFLGLSTTLHINLYTLTDAPLRYANLHRIGTASTRLGPGLNRMGMIEVPVTGTVPAGSTLVVEVRAPANVLSTFFLGAHPDGQTADSYLWAPKCGLREPTPTHQIGLPQLQFLINVTGAATVTGCDPLDRTPWLRVGQTSGTVAPGEAQSLPVTFDSAGLVDGDSRTAHLCLASNDPRQPRLAVPVQLDVVGVPAIEVTPQTLASQLETGQVEEHTLTVGNLGSATLDWQIHETSCSQPEDVPWLAVSQTAGSTGAGESHAVVVTVDPTGLPAGDHTTVLCVASNDPEQPRVTVPVELFTCDRIITGRHAEELTVTEGVTCLLPGAQVQGAVNVLDGAGLIARGATVIGPLATFGATVVELTGNQLTGPVSIRGTTGRAVMSGNLVVGSVVVVNNLLPEQAVVVSHNEIIGSLFCTGNQPAPIAESPNTLVGGLALDQCAGLAAPTDQST